MCFHRDDTQSTQDEEGCDSELLCLKIKTQLEDLFTDSHLAEDGFLLKHLQKNKQGYVSLKLLTCLKKVTKYVCTAVFSVGFDHAFYGVYIPAV